MINAQLTPPDSAKKRIEISHFVNSLSTRQFLQINAGNYWQRFWNFLLALMFIDSNTFNELTEEGEISLNHLVSPAVALLSFFFNIYNIEN